MWWYGTVMEPCRAQLNSSALAGIRALTAAEPELSRTALSRRVCEDLDWRDPTGRLCEVSCRIALNELERAGEITLPAPRTAIPRPRYRRRNDRRSYRMPDSVIVSLAALGELRMERVTGDRPELSAQWQELTARHHYLGAGPLCGRQLRYTVVSERYGPVATLAFTSPALRLAARDKWIGWDEETRRRHLDRVVCNARFLVLPWIKVWNLASKILAMCPQRVAEDWAATYGIDPVLFETFIDPVRFKGTCYAAAGWQCIGQSKGRGRQDRSHAHDRRPKRIFVRPLQEGFRDLLTAALPRPPVPVDYRTEGQIPWQDVELGAVDLGDERLNRRCRELASAFFANLTAAIPEACGSQAAARAAYRLFRHRNVSMDKILKPHYEATAGRIATQPEGSVVLAAQDTTFLNYSAHPGTEGLGPIGSTENGPVGLVLHDTMAFTPEGTPLGLVDIQCWTRDPEEFGLSEQKRNLPIEKKESSKWLDSYRAASVLQKRVPHVRIISVGDREADLYELFELAAGDPDGADLLVRATQNRSLENETLGLKDSVLSRPVGGVIEVHIPRRGSSPARDSDMEIRFGTVTVRPPSRLGRRPALSMQVVHIIEKEPSGPGDPVEWFLLTTCPVETAEQAAQVVRHYVRRWGIEIYHRILKSGCKMEDRQLTIETRLEKCLALDLVVAWRVFHLTMLGRECPELPASVCLEQTEWQVLCARKARQVPATPPRLRQAVLWIAELGGYMARPKDYLPGPTTVWRGIVKLESMVEGWLLRASMMPTGP